MCRKCGKPIWDDEQWADYGQVVAADAKFDGGEWSEAAHSEWINNNVCTCTTEVSDGVL